MSSGSWPKIKNRINSYQDQIIALQRDLTAIPALGPQNGGQGEYVKALYLEKLIKTLSPQTLLSLPCPDPKVPQGLRPNLLALFEGQNPSKTVWILSHMDIVPIGDLRLWKTDPFELKRKGDRLYGRGIEDNQHGIVSSFFAVKALQEEAVIPAYSIGLIWVSDEETGSHKGLEFVLKQKRRLFKADDLIIVPDAGNQEGTLIEVAEKSLLWVKFTLSGRQCHASRPDLGINTLRGTAHLIMALERLHYFFNKKDSSFDIPTSTFEPTQKEANVPNVNTIPGQDIFYLDCRILPQYPIKKVIEKIKEMGAEVEKKTGVRVKTEVVNAVQAPSPTGADAPVVLALQKAIESVYHKKAFPKGIGGATVAAFFREAGLPAAVWCTSSETAHQPNEYCRLSHLVRDAQVFAHIFCQP
ncbi:MAG: diaminopimelate aminotransferase [Desulfobacca sp.]|nr:diaminopimelate aminotransferase [Desulfobacca sp.]